MLLKATKYYVSMFLLYHKIKRKEFEMKKREMVTNNISGKVYALSSNNVDGNIYYGTITILILPLIVRPLF